MDSLVSGPPAQNRTFAASVPQELFQVRREFRRFLLITFGEAPDKDLNISIFVSKRQARVLD